MLQGASQSQPIRTYLMNSFGPMIFHCGNRNQAVFTSNICSSMIVVDVQEKTDCRKKQSELMLTDATHSNKKGSLLFANKSVYFNESEVN